MSDHEFDVHSLKQWLAGLEKPNEEEICKALMDIKQARVRQIIIAHIYDKRTFTDIGKEYGLTRQRIQQLFKYGIEQIRKQLGV